MSDSVSLYLGRESKETEVKKKGKEGGDLESRSGVDEELRFTSGCL